MLIAEINNQHITDVATLYKRLCATILILNIINTTPQDRPLLISLCFAIFKVLSTSVPCHATNFCHTQLPNTKVHRCRVPHATGSSHMPRVQPSSVNQITAIMAE